MINQTAKHEGFTAGQVLVGMAAAQLCGEEFLVGLDRHLADSAGQALTPVPGLGSTTAAGLVRRFAESQWAGVETGLGDVHAHALELLAGSTRTGRGRCQRTVDMDTSDVEVYGRLKQGVAFNHQGQHSVIVTQHTTSEANLAQSSRRRSSSARSNAAIWRP